METLEERFPFLFNDRADYNTNSQSYYDGLAKYNKVLQILSKMIEEYDVKLDNSLENINTVLTNYTTMLDGKLAGFDDSVMLLLREWIDDGTFEMIINTEIFNHKLDTTIFNDYKELLDQKVVTITPEMFGAVGDGITDDTIAFKAAASYMVNLASNPKNTFYTEIIFKLSLKQKMYNLVGNDIFSTGIPNGSTGNISPFGLILEGNGGTLLWEVEHEEDKLFNLDAYVDYIRVYDLNIFTRKDETKTFSYAGDVFSFHSFAGNANNTKNLFVGLRIGLAYGSGVKKGTKVSVKPRRVFANYGIALNDQSLVLDCNFMYFKTVYYSENAEAVNWSFRNCGFYGGGGGGSTYFEFTKMGDNFNVSECSFSLTANADPNKTEVLLKTIAPVGGDGKITQSSYFNFNFNDNRIEVYGNLNEELYLTDMNFGTLNMRNTNFRVASGAQNVIMVVKLRDLANINFENLSFNKVKFLAPMLTSRSMGGVAQSNGIYLKNCSLLRGSLSFFVFDGVNTYTLQDALVNKREYKNIIVENCHYLNSNELLNYEVINGLYNNVLRPEHVVRISNDGKTLGDTKITLPPYQIISKIVLCNFGTVPNTFSKFRIYFGDKTNGNYIDVDNPLPVSQRKEEFVLFEGSATIFTNDVTKQTITVYALDSGAEVTTAFAGEIKVHYTSISIFAMRITTVSDQTVIYQKFTETQTDSAAADITALKNDFNALLAKLRNKQVIK